MGYRIDWEGVYQAWKASKLSFRSFYHSESFRKLLKRRRRIPCLETFYLHLRNVRNRLETETVNSALTPPATEVKTQTEASDPQTVNVVRLNQNCLDNIKKLSRRNFRITRLRQVVVRLPDGAVVEFDCAAPELFVTQLLGTFKGERL